MRTRFPPASPRITESSPPFNKKQVVGFDGRDVVGRRRSIAPCRFIPGRRAESIGAWSQSVSPPCGFCNSHRSPGSQEKFLYVFHFSRARRAQTSLIDLTRQLKQPPECGGCPKSPYRQQELCMRIVKRFSLPLVAIIAFSGILGLCLYPKAVRPVNARVLDGCPPTAGTPITCSIDPVT